MRSVIQASGGEKPRRRYGRAPKWRPATRRASAVLAATAEMHRVPRPMANEPDVDARGDGGGINQPGPVVR
jgi:hypothetical protein